MSKMYEERLCEEMRCTNYYVPRKVNQKYCSELCKNRARNERWGNLRKLYGRQSAAILNQHVYIPGSGDVIVLEDPLGWENGGFRKGS